MATTVELKCTRREEFGKGASRRLRRDSRIPGVLYGRGIESVPLVLEARDFIRALSGHSASNLIVDLRMDAQAEVTKTLIREIQTDPVSGEVLHVDLNQISLTELLEVEVPVELEGVPSGVKNAGGILQHVERSVTVRCLPHNIPNEIKLDVSGLEINDAIRLSDLSIPEAEILGDPESTVASVLPPVKVEEPVEAEVTEEAEPEVVGKKKEGEDEGEKKESPGKGEE